MAAGVWHVNAKMLRAGMLHRRNMLTASGRSTYLSAMEQTQAGGQLRRVESALSQLESMIDERLRNERTRGDELATRLQRLEQQHEELRKVAMDVESRLERAMEYIRSLLAADQQ
jgi:4-aminobutyrate aminotransferase-like enzyme